MTKFTCKPSKFNKEYYVIYLDGKAWRVCHKSKIKARMNELRHG